MGGRGTSSTTSKKKTSSSKIAGYSGGTGKIIKENMDNIGSSVNSDHFYNLNSNISAQNIIAGKYNSYKRLERQIETSNLYEDKTLRNKLSRVGEMINLTRTRHEVNSREFTKVFNDFQSYYEKLNKKPIPN